MTHQSDTEHPSKTTGQWIGGMLALILLMSCFMGYQMGADLAHRDNQREAQAGQNQP
ncbi:hypothetical protein GRI97_09275 [Altererythrobacter xixiisoli]|uniref:Uncharacterized protein n=1 Tax=Croceibacterium xixiisoli TaxID=1476466 RepID=A0A6I4TVD7_9SPHN|nr:hypothetical protein [Croceibacterium xixiisoli]MXO99179.1 hypothetical protein [Croceibacterium xixiisoli]